MPGPIFVLGIARSGTTWLANLLLEHSKIAGACHEKHWGIHESAFFNRVSQRYGSLKNPVNFIEFAHVAAASDYFRLVGADLDYLYSLYPSTYPKVFRMVMDRYAASLDAEYWVEKTPSHTLFAESIAEYYPDARFIAIKRNVVDVTISALRSRERRSGQIHRSRKWLWLASRVMVWQLYRNVIRNLEKRFPERVFSLDYEELTENTESIMTKVCGFLNVDFESSLLTSSYTANSSFTGDPSDARDNVLTSLEKHWLETCKVVASMTPTIALSAAYKAGSKNFGGHSLPRSFFKLLPDAPRVMTERQLASQTFQSFKAEDRN